MDISTQLLSWYNENRRELPWRESRDPYRIWISEIILQQTRIDQGLPFYHQFLEAFPDIESLAGASEQEVLRVWQGLGYYSRARFMHITAQIVVAKHGGRLPESVDGLMMLPGIGPYTAAAIGSIAFSLPVPVMDGNVLRLFARFYGIELPVDSTGAKKLIAGLVREQMAGHDPGTFNQAIMEFGSLCCRPVGPLCQSCPLASSCTALSLGMVDRLPVKGRGPDKHTRYFQYLVLRNNEGDLLALNHRTGSDIWQGLYDFPMIETNRQVVTEDLIAFPEWHAITGGHDGTGIHCSLVYKHLLTHQRIIARFYAFAVNPALLPHLNWKRLDEIKSYPLPRLIERYLHDCRTYHYFR